MGVSPTHLPTDQSPSRQRFRIRWLSFSVLGALPGLFVAFVFTTGYADALLPTPDLGVVDTGWIHFGLLLLPGLLTGLGIGWGQREAAKQRFPLLWPFVSAAIYGAAWCVIAFAESLDIDVLHRIDVRRILLLTAFLLGVTVYLVLPLTLVVVKISDRRLVLLDRGIANYESLVLYLLTLFIVLPVFGLVRLREFAQPSAFSLVAVAMLFLGVIFQAGAGALLMRDPY